MDSEGASDNTSFGPIFPAVNNPERKPNLKPSTIRHICAVRLYTSSCLIVVELQGLLNGAEYHTDGNADGISIYPKNACK